MAAVDFTGRVIIVTGAGGGLGKSYALEAARRGANVVVNDLGSNVEGTAEGSQNLADQVVSEIQAMGGQAIANYADVSSPESAATIAGDAIKAFGRVDALINNAGNMRSDWFENSTATDFNAVVATHLLGSYNVTKGVWPHMKERGYGRIVFTSSSAGLYGHEMHTAYAAAKAGCVGLLNVLSIEGAEYGIRCNAVMPNAFSRMTDAEEEKMELDESATQQLRAVTQNSMNPEFTAALTLYLASEACNSTRELYSSCAGRMARVFIGATTGWQGSRTEPGTVEMIAEHIDEIRDLARGVHIPQSPSDEFNIVFTQPDPLVP